MNKIANWHGNLVLGKPSEGCRLCALGSKMVLFITGECDSNCFYCPIMKERRHDIIYANEQHIDSIEHAIKECKMISAHGVGITGGDPSLTLPRVVNYISSLKEAFGQDFHAHLYTSHALTEEQLDILFSSGLDEIRFHPPSLVLSTNIQKSIINARKINWVVGIEIPVIPDKQDKIKRIIDFAIESKLDFINLNEFEITEANLKRLSELGYKVKSNYSAAIEGSESLARTLLEQYNKSPITIHYCSARYKDSVQLKNRLLRRANNYAKKFDEITSEGLIVRGRIKTKDDSDPLEIANEIQASHKIPFNNLEIDSDHNCIYIHWKTARRLSKSLSDKYDDKIESIEIVHQYPYTDGIITYLEPLYGS